MPDAEYAIIRKVFSTMNIIRRLPRNALASSVARLIYAANSAPTPYRPHKSPDNSPIMLISMRLGFTWCEMPRSRKSISIPNNTITMPNRHFMIWTSAFLSSNMPGILPISTNADRGMHTFGSTECLSLSATTTLLG